MTLGLLDRLVQNIHVQPASTLILATSLVESGSRLRIELIAQPNIYYGCFLSLSDLMHELKSQWKRASGERDFEKVAIEMLHQTIHTGNLNVSDWADGSHSCTLHFVPPPSEGLPDFKVLLKAYGVDDAPALDLFAVASLALQQGQSQVKSIKHSSKQENDRLSKELTSTKRKISNLQSDLAAARREASASGSGTLNVPSGSQDSRGSLPPTPQKPPVKLHKGPLDYGRTGGRKVKHTQEFESDEDEDDEPTTKKSKQ